MGLETATYISGLNANNPVNATDGVGEGDDHLRLLKSTILNTFPNITGEVTATHTELNQLDGVDIHDASELTSGELADARLSSNVPLLDAASNTFTGDADFDALTATSFGGIDEGDLLDKSAAESISGQYKFTSVGGDGAVVIESTSPWIRWAETDQAVNEKNWHWGAAGKSFLLYTSTDASPGTIVGQAIKVVRGTGTAVDEIELNATLFDFNGAGDISGAFTVGGALTAASYGGIAEANLLDKTATETVSGAWTFTGTPVVNSSSTPVLKITEGDAAANEKGYQFRMDSGVLSIYTETDAGAVTSPALRIFRTGTTVDEIQLDATLLDFNGALDLSGTATIGGNITMTGTRAIDATTRLNLTGATVSVGESGGVLGFYGAAGQAKATISGSRSGNAALAGLLAELDDMGLITDNTTA